jgi:serine phosphatase RsbU (regulator of sigma subunit)
MLRELIDRATLEDFLAGLARASTLRIYAYDVAGELVAASPPTSPFARLTGHRPDQLPRPLILTPLPADEPPAGIAFVEVDGAWLIVAPVYVGERHAGFVAIGEFRNPAAASAHSTGAAAAAPPGAAAVIPPGVDPDEVARAHSLLPDLQRGGESRAVTTVRWASRMLAEWCRHELRLEAAGEQLALVGDIGELISGEQDLQKVLDRVVSETARALKCRFCSLRLYNPRTDELIIRAVHNLSPEYLGKGAVRRSESPIDDEALRGRLVFIEDVAHDPRFRYGDQARREGIVSVLTAGMLYRGEPVGVLRIYTDRRQRFRATHRSLLRAVAGQAAIAVVNARLIEQRLLSAELERDMKLAGQVQKRMIRTRPPAHPRIQTALIFEPSSHVGGDFCDFLPLPDGRLAAVVGDVVGHSVPAALLMASMCGALRATAQDCADLSEIVSRLNRHVCRETAASDFVTLLIAAVDHDARQLEYCNAGHEPLLRLHDGQVVPSAPGGTILGYSDREEFPPGRLELAPGDLLLLYTDGAVEASDFSGEQFGRARLRESLRQYGGLSPATALRNILWDIRRFVGLAELVDDLTLVALRVSDA